jgi:hypothetical protein
MNRRSGSAMRTETPGQGVPVQGKQKNQSMLLCRSLRLHHTLQSGTRLSMGATRIDIIDMVMQSAGINIHRLSIQRKTPAACQAFRYALRGDHDDKKVSYSFHASVIFSVVNCHLLSEMTHRIQRRIAE